MHCETPSVFSFHYNTTYLVSTKSLHCDTAILLISLQPPNQMEVSHTETIMDCHRYLLSVLFAKHLDLQHSASTSRPFTVEKLITDESVREFINKDITKSILTKHHRMSASNPSLIPHHHNNNNLLPSYALNDQLNDHLSSGSMLNDPSSDSLHVQFTRNLYHDPSGDIGTDPNGLTETKRIQNNMASYTTLDVDTIMCPQCNGQIPSHRYTEHLVHCYSTNHSYYEQDMKLNVNHSSFGSGSGFKSSSSRTRRKRTFSEMIKVDELLFCTPYRAECVPPNPLELKLEEQSESDVEAVSALCPPDINDRKKVVAQLIRKQNRFNLQKRTSSKNKGSPPSERKELEVFHKIFTKMVPKEEFSSSPSTDTEPFEHDKSTENENGDDEEDELNRNRNDTKSTKMEESDDIDDEEDDDDEDDSDDDKPIALNLKNHGKHSGSQSPKSPNNNTYNLRTRSPQKQKSSLLQSQRDPPSLRDTPQSERSVSISSKHSVDSAQSTASPLNSRMTKQQKYKEEYREMHRTFKQFYRDHRIRERKRRQRMEMRSKRNANKLVSDTFERESELFERDRSELDRLYGYLQRESKAMAQRTPFTRYPLSIQHSKDVLDLMLKFKVRTKHCGFIYDAPRPIDSENEKKKDDDGNEVKDEEDEQKTMRMSVDKEEADDEEKGEKSVNSVTDRNGNKGIQKEGVKEEGGNDEEKKEMDSTNSTLKFEHYCRLKLDKYGACKVHGDWRRRRYDELVSKMKREIEGIFIMKCALKHSDGLLEESRHQREMMDAEKEQFAVDEICSGKYDLIGYFSNEDKIEPVVPIQVDAANTDIDLLLESRFSGAIHRPVTSIESVAQNAVVYPIH